MTTTTYRFPPELRLVHPAHPLRHATQERAVVAVCARSAASWRRALSKLGWRVATGDDVKSQTCGRSASRRRRAAAAAATKACVAALGSGARLIPESPRRRRSAAAALGGGASSRTGRLSRAYFALASLWTLAERALGAAACAPPWRPCRADVACEFLARAPIRAALLWFGDTRVTNSACGGRKTSVLIGSRAVVVGAARP